VKGEIERAGRLIVGQSKKKLQLDDGAPLRMFFAQFVKQFIHGNHQLKLGVLAEDIFGQTFESHEVHVRSRSRVVNQVTPHDPRGQCQEMSAIMPVNIFGGSQAKESLIHESGWLKGVAVAFASKIACGQNSQIG
jgi:hypothetical protein